jgi:glyoxylase-like metal-dependent hydrolase (beta-lactamase superfamily II)
VVDGILSSSAQPRGSEDAVTDRQAWREVGDRVFVRRYAFYDQDIGVIVGPEGVLIVDTRTTHRQAREILDDLRQVTKLPVVGVIDTHHHHDHTFGNHVFRPAPIWGHVRCRTRLRETFERQRESLLGEPRTPAELAADLVEVVCDPPDRTFEEQAFVDLAGRRVELRYLGRGHTDDDIVVLVPDCGVLFAGDLLEGGAPPWFGDGYPLDWPETCSRLLELVRAAVVPGHGDIGDRRFVEDHLTAFLAVAELGRRVDRGELSLEEATAAGPYEVFRPGASREPIERALAQLRGELD